MVSNISLEQLMKKAPALSRETGSEEETMALARAAGGALKGGDWVVLVGELGSGKTLFTQGIGEALGCRQAPVSPTFSLIRIHPPSRPGKLCLRHVDLYRLKPPEVPALEWEDLLGPEGVTVVEWAEKAEAYWPDDPLVVRLFHVAENIRRVEFYAGGPRAAEIISRTRTLAPAAQKGVRS